MCPTISLRISDKTKENFDLFKGKIDWNNELREFIEKKIDEERKKDLLDQLESIISELPVAPQGAAVKLVREDRDSH